MCSNMRWCRSQWRHWNVVCIFIIAITFTCSFSLKVSFYGEWGIVVLIGCEFDSSDMELWHLRIDRTVSTIMPKVFFPPIKGPALQKNRLGQTQRHLHGGYILHLTSRRSLVWSLHDMESSCINFPLFLKSCHMWKDCEWPKPSQ